MTADILLIQPPMADFYLTAKRTLPYGLACMAATLRENGFSVSLLDAMATGKSRPMPLPAPLSHLVPFYGRPDITPMALFHAYRHFGYSLSHLQQAIKTSNAFLVGISALFTPYSDMALAVARAAKAALPKCTVVLGGHHPTALPEAVLAEPAVDFVIRGEGETALQVLARALRSGKSPGTVPGICYRKKDGSCVVNPPVRVSDTDPMPPPALDLLNRKFYQRRGKDSLVITTSRGCPMACSYCATNRKSWMGFRKRPVAAVLAEIRAAKAGRQIGFIDFEDEHLTLDPDGFLELLAGIRDIFKDALPELRAMNGLFPPSLTVDAIQAMKASGFTALNLSIGSADTDQLRRFGRPDVRDAVDAALAWAGEEGLSAVGYIIVAAPDQDPLVSVDDLLFLARRPILAGVSVFYPAPGSDDYQRCQKLGLLPASFSAMGATALPIDQKTSRQDAVTLLRLGRILNFMKALISAEIPLPQARPMDVDAFSAEELTPANRQHLGCRILSAFFHDGRIFGVDTDGRVYGHQVSPALCDRFLAGIRKTPVAGCR